MSGADGTRLTDGAASPTLLEWALALPPQVRDELRRQIDERTRRRAASAGVSTPDPDDLSPEIEARIDALLMAEELATPPAPAPRPALPTSAPEREPVYAITLREVAPERVEWLSRGRLARGKLTLLDGDPGLGKSTLLCDWAARISRGEALPDGEAGAPRGVLLLSAEDGLADTIRPRLEAAGADLSRILALLAVPDGTPYGRPPMIPTDLPLLEEMIRRGKVALAIVDPLMAYLDPDISAHHDQDVRRALAHLKGLGERTGAAIVVVRHLNKAAGMNALYRGGGSIGIIGAARCGLLLGRDPDDPEARVLAHLKGNLSAEAASLGFRLESAPETDVARIVWTGASPHRAADLLHAANDDPDERSALADAAAWLRAALADGPKPTVEIHREAAEQGIAERTLQRARRQLGVAARKDGHNRRWLMALPGGDGPNRQGRQPSPYPQSWRPWGDVGGLADLTSFAPNVDRSNPGERTRQELLPVGHEDAASTDDVWPCLDCGNPMEAGQRYRCVACAERARLEVAATAASPSSDHP